MSDAVTAQELVREVYSPKMYGSVKAALYQAFRDLNKRTTKQITERRIRSLWDGTAKRIDGEELDALRAQRAEHFQSEQIRLRQRLSELDEILAGRHEMETS